MMKLVPSHWMQLSFVLHHTLRRGGTTATISDLASYSDTLHGHSADTVAVSRTYWTECAWVLTALRWGATSDVSRTTDLYTMLANLYPTNYCSSFIYLVKFTNKI